MDKFGASNAATDTHSPTEKGATIDPILRSGILGNEYMGETPLTFKDAAEGFHNVARIVKSPITKALQAVKKMHTLHM